ncbi:MAG TPA: lipid A export permease/ATP-binding protein MsbA [Nitrospirota bacterium]|nr:lipid A export permease/ATP-binding protein MsbA [Nitrospirota bacterium]
MTSFDIYKRLLTYLTPYKKRLFLSLFFMGITSGLISLQAYLVQPVLDKVFLQKDMRLLLLLPPALMLVVILKGASAYARDYLMGWIGQRIVNNIRDEIYFHLTSLSFSFYTRTPTGVLISRIINDVNLVQGALTRAPSSLVQGVLTMAALTVYVLYKDWRLALFSVVVMPFLGVALSRFSRRYRRASTQMQEQYGDLTIHLHETIAGIRIVKAFGMEAYENRRFAERNRGLFNSLMRQIKVSAISHPIMETISTLGIAIVILIGGYWIIGGRLSVGEFFSFMAALYFLYRPIKELNGVNNLIQDGIAAAQRIFGVLDTPPEIRDRDNAPAIRPDFKEIELRDVSFRYDETPVLKGISLRIRSGETVAIVGKSGGGKTTLANLLPRFFDVTGGAILIGGQDIREVSQESLRSLIAIVTQQTILFNDTVRSNIAYGSAGRSFEEVVAAATAAYADDFIRTLPQGYDTVIGEAGVKLSGGQRQRVAIARALLKNAPILILDEATSSLDTQSEREVQRALDRLMVGRTSFVIAHRLSTIMNADRIIVLKEGVIVEQGRHEELLSLNGEYRLLYEQQFREETAARTGE